MAPSAVRVRIEGKIDSLGPQKLLCCEYFAFSRASMASLFTELAGSYGGRHMKAPMCLNEKALQGALFQEPELWDCCWLALRPTRGSNTTGFELVLPYLISLLCQLSGLRS